MSPLRSLLAIVFTWVIGPAALAQIPNATNTTATPAPGMHDYLGSSAETVNPANGSVSIRVPVRMAQGRQFTLPFSFAYDSNGAFYVSQRPVGTQAGAPRYMTTTTVIGSQGGWSYSYPVMSFFGASWQIPGNLDHMITCHGSMNYVFQDPNGNRHNLGLSVSPNIASPDGENCNQGIEGDGEFTVGGEGPILATTTIPSANNTVPSVTIVDGDGLTYALPGGTPVLNGMTTLATGVTDHNGNSVTIANSNGAVTYTDTLGRTALSTSGMGASPDTITVSGLGSPYHVYWTTTSPNFTDNMLNLCTGGGCQPCPTTLSASSSVISSIVLPTGGQFTFTYDPTHGMLTKIVYPSGGYVRYVWGLNPQAEQGDWSSTTTSGSAQTWNCRYDFPAVTDRYVSYDGVTEVLHQHFSYSTNWSSNTSISWNYKTTTVTTTDAIRNTSFITTYTYSPIGIAYIPNCNLCSLNVRLPVEQTIQYNDTNGSLLRTVTKSWQNVRLLTSQQSTFPNNGPSSLTVYCYNTNELETERDEYDFGMSAPTLPTCASGVPTGTVSGPLLRKTVTSYATFGTNHIVDKPSKVQVYDGTGTNLIAETNYTYDTPGGTVTSGIVQHGAGCNCGNLTVQSQWLNSSGATLGTNFTNDDTGQRLSMTDARGNQTTYSYTDSYSSGTPPGPTNAYLTTVTYPNTGVAHV